MRKLIKGFATILAVLLLTGCFLIPSGNSIYDYWSWTGTVLSMDINDTLRTLSATIDNDLDDYFSAMIMHVTEDSLITYMNNQEDGTYTREGNAFTVTEDSIIFAEESEENMQQFFNDDNELVLSIGEYDSTGAVLMEMQMIFTKYTGMIPPENWTSPIQDDLYEPDTTNYTIISVGETQTHTITEDDDDYFSFTATQGHTYLLQVNAYFDAVLYLMQTTATIIDYDDDNDDDIEGLEGNVESVLRWTARTSGEVWLVVEPYSSEDIGYYEIKIVDEGIMAKPTNTSSSLEGMNFHDRVKRDKDDLLKKYTDIIMDKMIK